MKEISLQDIYDGFAAEIEKSLPITTPGQRGAYNAVYRNILPQFRDQIVAKIIQILEDEPEELIEQMEQAIMLFRRFEATYAPK